MLIYLRWMNSAQNPIAARIPLSGLADPKANLEYLARDSKWMKGFDPANAQGVRHRGYLNFQSGIIRELGRWLAVMFDPSAFSRNILLRSAPSAIGPWSAGKVIFSVPEMDPGSHEYDKDTFCYAGKEHPEFERGDLVITYVCNSFAVAKLATNLNIYFPKTVRMPMPQLPEKSTTQ